MKTKHLLLLLLTGVAITNAMAQPIVKAQRTVGGSLTDGITDMCLTRDGGLIFGGSSWSDISGQKTENSRGYSDYWIVKADSTYKIQWDKTIGGNSYDYFTSVEQTLDGGYILGGYSQSGISGEKTEKTIGRKGYEDYWVVKLDSDGNIQWDKTIGGDLTDQLHSLSQTKDGGYILGGYSESNISGNKTENNRGLGDYWIVKLDSNGNIEWDKTIGGYMRDELGDLQQTSDGGYILGGVSQSNISGEKTQISRGKNDYWLIKLNASGSIEWDKTIGGNSYDNLTCVQQTADGGYILGGYSTSGKSGEKTEKNRGGDNTYWDYWVIKTDRSGNILWQKTIGGDRNDYLFSLQHTIDGGYVLGGYSDSNISGEKTEESRGYNDYWVVKLDSAGHIQWDKTIGGSGFDGCRSILEVAKNKYLLGGGSTSGISGDKTQKVIGDPSYSDCWLVLLDYKKQAFNNISHAENVSVSKLPAKDFGIYPNPAKDILHFQTNGKATVTLTDQSGKIILTKTINNNGEINVSHLPAGLYYLKNIKTGEMQKVIVAH